MNEESHPSITSTTAILKATKSLDSQSECRVANSTMKYGSIARFCKENGWDSGIGRISVPIFTKEFKIILDYQHQAFLDALSLLSDGQPITASECR